MYESHGISTCSKLTEADKADLKTNVSAGFVEEVHDVQMPRSDDYEAPGWDCEEIIVNEKEINEESYVCSFNSSPVQFNLIEGCNLQGCP